MSKLAGIKLGHNDKIVRGVTFSFSNPVSRVAIKGDLAEDGYDYNSSIRLHVDSLKETIKSVYYGDKFASIELNVLDIKLHPDNKKCFMMALAPINYDNALYDNAVMFMMVNEIAVYFANPDLHEIRSEFKSFFV